jgi:hypothetical protein
MFKKTLIALLLVAVLFAAGANASRVQAAPASLENAATVSLSADETAGLLYMYEEEKLARDVYTALYALWGQTTFEAIARSEQTHMDAIATLLTRYGIAIPGTTAGTFSDPTLQSLYDSLIETGSRSLAEALKMGATIEEVDIADLQSRLTATSAADIQLVYNNLMSGSYNHLRNFTGVLSRLSGETYQPQVLSADLYQTIVSSTNGRGYGSSAGTGTNTGTSGSRGHRGGK